MNDTASHRHHRRSRRDRHERAFVKFARTYAFELVGLLVIVAGLLLVLERARLRRLMMSWLTTASQAMDRGLSQLNYQAARLATQITFWDAIGFALILGAAIAIALRIRYRLLNNPALTTQVCPTCGGHLQRVHRTAWDRIINRFVPVRRFRCADHSCGWTGLRIGQSHQGSRSHHSGGTNKAHESRPTSG